MASYGKKEYWNERYAQEGEEPCEWITGGYSVFHHLLSPTFLSHTQAPLPGGYIVLNHLNNWPGARPPQCPMLYDYDSEEGGHEYESTVAISQFPPNDYCRVLHVGCGNSELGEHMLHHGFNNIVNVDYSEVVIKKMQEKYDANFFAELTTCLEQEEMLKSSLGLESRDDSTLNASRVTTPKMSFELGDITEGLHYPSESFDLIICKKTLDMVLCSSGSVGSARSMMSECFRLLNNEHGVMIILSSAKPEDRAYFFEQDAWSGVENIKLPSNEDGQFNHRKGHERKKTQSYVYILYKQSWRNEEDLYVSSAEYDG